MPLRNRVTPFSDIIAHPARGLLFGNRGCLHDGAGIVRRQWGAKLWIACLTEFKGRRRPLLLPGKFTELFFLDEAVALAAGHRPCAECRRADYDRFRAAWASARLPPAPHAGDLDRILHAARRDRAGHQQRHVVPFASLPDGAFVAADDDRALLVLGDRLLPYDPAGYGPSRPRPAAGPAEVLTPAPLVAVLGAGYRPLLHPSAA
jgi:hypothetical protein